MNRADLVEYVADELRTSKVSAARAIDAVFDAIARAVASGEDVRLVGFGTFVVTSRAATKGRNPATGEELRIPAGRNVRFRAGTALKTALNERP